MGTIKKGILGGFSGKVGTVVGASWKGIAYMRGQAQSIKNPRTRDQVAQREKLKFTVAFLKRFATFIALGTWSGKGSNMNAAVACNLKNAVGFSDGAVVIDFSKLTLSRGRLAKAMAASCLDDGGDKTIRWECAGGGSYDLAVGVAVNTTTNETYIQKSGDDIRDNAEMILNLPDSWGAAPVACYILFQSADLTSVSDSVYAGVIGE
ncbi:MAG: DUF6266 family protein [Bacteroidales bacterium]|nr:DUF6266 family protein [Bacteroidales bacterium]